MKIETFPRLSRLYKPADDVSCDFMLVLECLLLVSNTPQSLFKVKEIQVSKVMVVIGLNLSAEKVRLIFPTKERRRQTDRSG